MAGADNRFWPLTYLEEDDFPTTSKEPKKEPKNGGKRKQRKKRSPQKLQPSSEERPYQLDCSFKAMEDIQRSPAYASFSYHTYGTPMELASFSTELSSASWPNNRETGSFSDERCKHFKDIQYNRKLCDDDKRNLSPIAERYLLNRKDAHLKLYEGFAANKMGKPDEIECMGLSLECLTKEDLIGGSDFVCRRGLLTRICELPYVSGKDDYGMIVSVQKVGLTYYMLEFETSESCDSSAMLSMEQKKIVYGGKKFEALVSARQANTRDFNDEYVSVSATQFGDHTLMIRGEIDGCLPNDHSSYVELKTTTEGRQITTEKAMKWWLQSHLVGTKKIVCGFRDNHSGIVKKVSQFRIEDLVSGRQGWSPDVCFLSLEKFLDFVKENIEEEYQPYYLKRNQSSKVFTLHEDSRGEYKFLPKWMLADRMEDRYSL